MGNKWELKKEIVEKDGLHCYLCGIEISEQDMFDGTCDIHRVFPKAEGGTYQIDTTRILCPICHMKQHNIHRIRPEELGTLKIAIDDREQWMKLLYKIQNQLRAYKRRTDEFSDITKKQLEDMLEELQKKVKDRTRLVDKWIKDHKDEGIIKSALNVDGLGPQTIAYLITYCIPEKAKHRSSYWKYAGLHCASHERYKKGVAGGGNKRLRMSLWRCCDSMWKKKGNPYREVGLQVKERRSNSLHIVKTRNTQGKLVELPWKDTKPGHRHGDAIRRMSKEILGDFWVVSRKFAGLPTDNPYVIDMLGHEQMTDPRTRGWLFPEDIEEEDK